MDVEIIKNLIGYIYAEHWMLSCKGCTFQKWAGKCSKFNINITDYHTCKSAEE